MSGALEAWQVQEHGALVEIEDGILTVEGAIKMPLGKFPRRMTVVRLADSSTAIYSPIALSEPEMKKIDALGKPTFLIVPNAHHRMDAKIWRQRYPQIRVLAPPGAREAVAEIVPVDATSDVFGDPKVRLVDVAGTEKSEFALLVTRAAGSSLIVNDVIAHVAHPDGVGAKVMAVLFGFGVKQPEVPRVVKYMLIKDKPALAQQFRDWANLPNLRRLIVSHGDVIERPKEVLSTLADALDG